MSKSLIKFILVLLFLIYSFLYISNLTGYSSTFVKHSNSVTQKNIKDFEERISNGEIIDLKSYLKDPKDEIPVVSKVVLGVSDELKRISRDILRGISKYFYDSLK